MDEFEIVKSAALNAAVSYPESDGSQATWVEMIRTSVDLYGTQLVNHVDRTDVPGILLPVDVFTEGKWRTGALLTLQDRAIVAWAIGTVRIRSFERVIPFATISQVSSRPAESTLNRPRAILDLGCEPPVRIRIWELQGVLNPSILEATLRGAITFSADADDSESESIKVEPMPHPVPSESCSVPIATPVVEPPSAAQSDPGLGRSLVGAPGGQLSPAPTSANGESAAAKSRSRRIVLIGGALALVAATASWIAFHPDPAAVGPRAGSTSSEAVSVGESGPNQPLRDAMSGDTEGSYAFKEVTGPPNYRGVYVVQGDEVAMLITDAEGHSLLVRPTAVESVEESAVTRVDGVATGLAGWTTPDPVPANPDYSAGSRIQPVALPDDNRYYPLDPANGIYIVGDLVEDASGRPIMPIHRMQLLGRTGHTMTKTEALGQLLKDWTPVEGSAKYEVVPVVKSGIVFMLVTDPQTGDAHLGDSNGLREVLAADVTTSAGKATGVEGYTTLNLGGLVGNPAYDKQWKSLVVPMPDGSGLVPLGTNVATTAVPTYTYDSATDTLTNRDSREVYEADYTLGSFVSVVTGEPLLPGWKPA